MKTDLPEFLTRYDVEYQLLGSLMLHGEDAQHVADRINPADAASKFVQRALAALFWLVEHGKTVNMIAVDDALQNRQDSDSVELATALGDADHRIGPSLDAWLDLVYRRRLWRACARGFGMLEGGRVKADEVEAMLHSSGAPETQSEWVRGDVAAVALIPHADQVKPLRVKLGWPIVDEWIGGVAAGSSWVIGGITSHGKTAAAVAIARAFLKAGKRVSYAAYEARDSVLKRFVSSVSGLPLHILRDAELRNATVIENAVTKGGPMLERLALGEEKTVAQLVSHVRREKPDLLVVDYIQLQAAHERLSGSDDRTSWGIVVTMQRLKHACVTAGTACLFLAQLNERAILQRESSEPHNSDVMESSGVVQAADVVLMVHWPHRIDASKAPGEYVMIVSKNKDGRCGRVRCRFDSATLAIEEEVDDGSPRSAGDAVLGGQDRAAGEAEARAEQGLWGGA